MELELRINAYLDTGSGYCTIASPGVPINVSIIILISSAITILLVVSELANLEAMPKMEAAEIRMIIISRIIIRVVIPILSMALFIRTTVISYQMQRIAVLF